MDKITAEELEKKRKEYARMLMKMAERSVSGTNLSEAHQSEDNKAAEALSNTEEAPETTADTANEAVEAVAEIQEETAADALPKEIETIAEDDINLSDEIKEAQETAIVEEDISETSFGVFTAEEILNGDYSGEGFEKAAEMIEEITKKKEIMKEFAQSGGTETDCDCKEEVPEIADAQDIFGEAEICPKCGKRKSPNGRHG